MIIKVSPSTLNLIAECPRCFYLAVVKKIPRPSSGFPTLPSGMDKMLKEHFDRFRDKNELPPELKLHKIDAQLFEDVELLKKWRNNRAGIEYFDEQQGILLRGAIDNVLSKDGKLIILDYKTRGFALKEDTPNRYQDQMNLYTFLLQKNGYNTEEYAYLLFYLPERIQENGEFIFKTDLIKMKVSVEHAEQLFKRAITLINGSL